MIKRVLVIFLALILLLVSYNLAFLNRIFPGISIAGINLGGLTSEAAVQKLTEKIKFPDKILLRSETRTFEIPLEAIGFTWEPLKTVERAYNYHRTGNIFVDLSRQVVGFFKKTNLALMVSFDEEKFTQNLAAINATLVIEPVYPELKISSAKVWVEKGKAGSEIDLQLLRLKIGTSLAGYTFDPIEIPVKQIDPRLTEAEAERWRLRGENLYSKNLTLKYDLYSNFIPGETLISFLDAKDEYQQKEITSLVQKVASDLNREPQNSTFVFLAADGTGKTGRVQEFTPAKDGIKVKTDLLQTMIVGNLRTLENSDKKDLVIEIPVELIPPQIKTGDANNLGIKELLGRGVSYFRGSIPSRIHNISLATSKFKGVLVAPGEVFSFNQILGDVSTLTGYQQAYIIKNGRTILGDGGGVCQVSSTLFRAVLNAGLPIIERKAHSYRVSYYEQNSPVGLDATVYNPTADLKFKNDTPAHILIQPQINLKNSQLIFEIYGTADGRVSQVSKPVISNLTPPPEDLYQDDPTLPAGVLKQIDWKAWGAKVTYSYTVSRGGETIFQKTFVSNYQPWRAVYLRGTGPSQ